MKPIHIITGDDAAAALCDELARRGQRCTWGPSADPAAKYLVMPGPRLPSASEVLQAVRAVHDGDLSEYPASGFSVRRQRPAAPPSITLDEPPTTHGAFTRTGPPVPSRGTEEYSPANPFPVPVQAPAVPESPSPLPTWFAGARQPPREICIVTVLRSGPKYRAEHVRWLLRQCCRHITTPFRFICLSDDPAVPGHVPLLHADWPKWWPKLEAFRPDLYSSGETVLYLDLDTVITRGFAIPEPPPTPHLYMIHFSGWWWTKYGSGVMLFRAPFSVPYDWFCRHPQAAMDALPSDQEAILAAIIQAGGTIRAMPDAEVQFKHETASIPQSQPSAGLFCTAGVCGHSWEIGRPWIPPLVPETGVVADLALVTCWYGDDPLRLAAARRGLARLDALPVQAAVRVLVEAVDAPGKTRFPDWRGRRLEIVLTERQHDLWHKEGLLNLGAIATLGQAVPKLLIVDADTFPAPEWERYWLRLTSDRLDSCSVLQPWYGCREDDPTIPDAGYRSYAWTAAAGASGIFSGQGFAIAMTRQWFEGSGGLPDHCMAGAGDAMTIEQWDKRCRLSPTYRDTWADWRQMLAEYTGPRIDIAWLPCTLVHASHGRRDYGAGYRCYHWRHYIWDWAGGWQQIIERADNGLWQWQDTPLARMVAAVQARRAEIVSMETLRQIYGAECARHDIAPAPSSVPCVPSVPIPAVCKTQPCAALPAVRRTEQTNPEVVAAGRLSVACPAP